MACGGLGVRDGVVSGEGLGKLLRYHADCLDGRLTRALALVFGLGAGRLGGATHKEDPPVCVLESGGQAGLLARVYYICQASGWLWRLGALRSQFATSKMSHVLIPYSPSAPRIDSMMLESSSLATAKLLLPASFSDAPTR